VESRSTVRTRKTGDKTPNVGGKKKKLGQGTIGKGNLEGLAHQKKGLFSTSAKKREKTQKKK